jgi:hypothetical protein
VDGREVGALAGAVEGLDEGLPGALRVPGGGEKPAGVWCAEIAVQGLERGAQLRGQGDDAATAGLPSNAAYPPTRRYRVPTRKPSTDTPTGPASNGIQPLIQPDGSLLIDDHVPEYEELRRRLAAGWSRVDEWNRRYPDGPRDLERESTSGRGPTEG